MRVKITYGVDIENVPEIVKTLGSEVADELKKALGSLNAVVDNVEECSTDFTLVMEILNRVRLRLNTADLAIRDMEAVVTGLNDFYKEGDEDVPDRRPPVDPSGNAADTTEE